MRSASKMRFFMRMAYAPFPDTWRILFYKYFVITRNVGMKIKYY